MSRALPRFARRFARSTSGIALTELAFVMPILLLFTLTGAELCNFITVKMRVSQLALRIADDAARMGSGPQLAAKTVTESDVNDLFTGANLQSSELNLQNRARVVLSDLEPMANPNTTSRYKIVWQRCYGAQSGYTRQYGLAGDTNLVGMGPAGRKVTAQDDNATMFVEVYYQYRPLVSAALVPQLTFVEIASMAVRDRRDLVTTTVPQGQRLSNASNSPIAWC